jgi:hypothetical protein
MHITKSYFQRKFLAFWILIGAGEAWTVASSGKIELHSSCHLLLTTS